MFEPLYLQCSYSRMWSQTNLNLFYTERFIKFITPREQKVGSSALTRLFMTPFYSHLSNLLYMSECCHSHIIVFRWDILLNGTSVNIFKVRDSIFPHSHSPSVFSQLEWDSNPEDPASSGCRQLLAHIATVSSWVGCSVGGETHFVLIKVFPSAGFHSIQQIQLISECLPPASHSPQAAVYMNIFVSHT